jgi:hypothetical protein
MGPIALYNSYPFFREDVFAFKRGIGGRYEKGGSLYIIVIALAGDGSRTADALLARAEKRLALDKEER